MVDPEQLAEVRRRSYDPDHLALIRRGVKAWNKWRREHPDVQPNLARSPLAMGKLHSADLHGVDLQGADLRIANLSMADLRRADLRRADLSGAKLLGTDLRRADLRSALFDRADLRGAMLHGTGFLQAYMHRANLSGADLHGADLLAAKLRQAILSGADMGDADLTGSNLSEADLVKANMDGANLRGADLNKADLREANLAGADLGRADLNRADLREANLAGANLCGVDLRSADLGGANLESTSMSNTVFALTDLAAANGLETIRHLGPSTLDHRTYARSGGLPYVFLRGCGLPDSLISAMPSLLGNPIEQSPCFICYNPEDQAFARQLYNALQARGTRCWLRERQLRSEDDDLGPVSRDILRWDRVLLCCSKYSLNSWWVSGEVDNALVKEERLRKKRGQRLQALIPLDLDGYLSDGWDGEDKRKVVSRVVVDFRDWDKDDAKFDAQLAQVIRILRSD